MLNEDVAKMINYVRGNILKAKTEALVNPVNCVGVMGRGLALQFKHAFPANFQAYFRACRRGELRPGRMLTFDTGSVEWPRYVVNFPTKRHWRDKSLIEDIEAGLVSLAREVQLHGIQSIAIPPLGCGLGGLCWDDVRLLMECYLGDLNGVSVIVFKPSTHGGSQ
jgi:O-acetyl-ADP-ribose deacetylase (regulator of RNase III)